VSGILVSTLLTMFVLPGVLQIAMRGWKPDEDEEPIHAAPPSLRPHALPPPAE
jgi:hypothetical protein